MFSDERKLIILDGLQDHIVVNNSEMLIIIPRKKIESIQKLRNAIINKFGNELK